MIYECSKERIIYVAKRFFPEDSILNIKTTKKGNINNTFVIEFNENKSQPRFILQRISKIFSNPSNLVRNHEIVVEVLKNSSQLKSNLLRGRYFEAPSLIRCKANDSFIFKTKDEHWRAMDYIESTKTISTLLDYKLAYEVGYGLGLFHEFVSELKEDRLFKLIPHFHDLDFYIKRNQYVVKDIPKYSSNKQIYKRLEDLRVLFEQNIERVIKFKNDIASNVSRKYIIHGDPKLSNFLFSTNNNSFISLIDLDTVSTGYLLTDLADCLRSSCNLGGEDPSDFGEISFNLSLCEEILKGYYSVLGGANLNNDILYLPNFLYLIIFELAIRFLTDFLESNSYFKVEHYSHNLHRAEVQFKLLDDLSSKWDELMALSHYFANNQFVT